MQQSQSDAQFVWRIILIIMALSGVYHLCVEHGSDLYVAVGHLKNISISTFEYIITHISSIISHVIGWGFLSYFVFSYFSLYSRVKEIQNQLDEIKYKLDD